MGAGAEESVKALPSQTPAAHHQTVGGVESLGKVLGMGSTGECPTPGSHQGWSQWAETWGPSCQEVSAVSEACPLSTLSGILGLELSKLP